MTWLQFVEQMTGHLAWPLAAFLISLQFKNELRQFIARIRNATFGGAELDLAAELQQVKQSAEGAGITTMYDPSAFSRDAMSALDAAPEWAFIKAWQDIERLLDRLYAPHSSSAVTSKAPVRRKIGALLNAGVIDDALASVVTQLHDTRNRVVHESGHSVTRGEALEWLGISKSVADRLRQKVDSPLVPA